MKSEIDSKFILGCFFFLAIITFFCNNTPLFDQDEAAYAGFAKNMLENKNWLLPNFFWSDIHRKTPLHFWNIAISYKIFGIKEFAVRFSSAVFVFLTYVTVYILGKKIVTKIQAFYASMILATSLLVPALGKIAVTDGTLLFFTVLCAFALIFILKNKSWKWVLIFWTSFSLALLCKGPPIIIFSSLFGILLLFSSKRKNLIILHPWFFLPLAAMPTVIWGYLTVQEDGGDLLLWMWDWYVVKRVNSSVLGQTGPPGSHLIMMILFFLPWIILVPKALKGIFLGIFKTKNINFILASWFISSWLIFEFSPSKLPAYVVSAHVPLSFFISFQLEKISSLKKIKYWISGTLLFQFIIWIIALPLFNDLRNNTLSVSNYIDKNSPYENHILIGNNKHHPPSLPFYLSMNNKNLGFEKNLSTLLWHYYQNKGLVLILNRQQKDTFNKLVPNVKFKKINRPDIFNTFLTQYYIIIKDKHNMTTALPIPDKKDFFVIPASKKAYKQKINNNSRWKNSLINKAKKNNLNYETQVQRDIDWLYKQDSLLYCYQLEMYTKPRWIQDIKLKQNGTSKSIKEICQEDLLAIKNNSENNLKLGF